MEFDAIVVGARIAGAATAALLAEQGARVLLVDRATFPEPTLSCPVFFSNSLAMFDRIGVLDAIEALGAPRIRYYGSRGPGVDLVTHLPPVSGRDYAYSIRREILDTTVLREVSRRPGVTVREGFSVTDLLWGAGQVVGVRGRQNGGPEEAIYARAVIGADGKRSLVARLVDAPVYDSAPALHCIFFAYYRNFKPLHEPSAISYINADRSGGTLVFDADEGLTVVSVGLLPEQFAEAKKDPEGALERGWRSIPELAERGRDAVRATRVMGQGPVGSFYRQSYGPGWALVGDAGHYIDPITGQGINNALHSAELFSGAWARTRQRWSWTRAMGEYQRQRDRETRPMYNLTTGSGGLQQLFRTPFGTALMDALGQAIARQPEVASQYVGLFNGATRINDFFNPLNLSRILAQDALNQSVTRLASLRGQTQAVGA